MSTPVQAFVNLDESQQRSALAAMSPAAKAKLLTDLHGYNAQSQTPNYGDFARTLASRSAPKVPTPAGLQGPPSAIQNLSEQTHGALVEGAKDVGRTALGLARMAGANVPGPLMDQTSPLVQTALSSQNPVRDTTAGALGVDVVGVQQASQDRNYPMLAEKTIAPIATVLAGGSLLKDPADVATAKSNLIAALKPGKNQSPKVVGAIDRAVPELQQVAQANPKSLAPLHAELQKVSLGYESKFQGYIKPYENAMSDTTPIADRIQSVIDKQPEKAQELQPLVDKYRNNLMSLKELNARRPDVSGVERAGINDLLYGELERLNPTKAGEISSLRNSQSAVLTLQDAVKNRINSLITPDAWAATVPEGQRFMNAAEKLHVTRPATIATTAYRYLNRPMPSDASNVRIRAAMDALAGTRRPIVGGLAAMVSENNGR